MSGHCRLSMNKCTQLPLMLPTYIHRHHVNKRGNVQTGWNPQTLQTPHTTAGPFHHLRNLQMVGLRSNHTFLK